MCDTRRWLDYAGRARCRNRPDASHVCQTTGPEDDPAHTPSRVGRLRLSPGDADRTQRHLKEALAIAERLGTVAPNAVCPIRR